MQRSSYCIIPELNCRGSAGTAASGIRGSDQRAYLGEVQTWATFKKARFTVNLETLQNNWKTFRNSKNFTDTCCLFGFLGAFPEPAFQTPAPSIFAWALHPSYLKSI